MKATSSAGQRLFEASQALIPTLRERAHTADLKAEVATENINDLIKSGITAAFVPQDLGGMGMHLPLSV